MRIKRNNIGFTLAEMLIVMAIIGILGGVSYIAVQNHQRNTTQLEHDTVAKEIFIAAQNHLTMAESQGFLGIEDYGTKYATSTKEGDSAAYYFIASNAGSGFETDEPDDPDESDDPDHDSMLDLMLPPGSIDDTVRLGGSYVIYYQPRPALVLDVFYWDEANTFGSDKGWNSSADDYPWDSEGKAVTVDGFRTLLTSYGGNGKREARKAHTPILGWYGGVEARASGDVLQMPTIQVANAEKLTVTVNDPNFAESDTALKLYIVGLTSGARASIQLRTSEKDKTGKVPTRVVSEDSEYTVTLDDVTTDDSATEGMHFADINSNTQGGDPNLNVAGYSNGYRFDNDVDFIPGEDIVVEAVAYSDSKLTSIAYSNRVTTNSLFADLVIQAETETQKGSTTALIANFRHLENLNEGVSNFDYSHFITDPDKDPINAVQLADLDWTAFVTATGGTVSTYIRDFGDDGEKLVAKTKTGCYLPVSASYPLLYDGKGHSITGVRVENDEGSVVISNGGVFGALENSEISNLELIDTSVKLTSGNAGALAGKMTGCTVTNVLARNGVDAQSDGDDTESDGDDTESDGDDARSEDIASTGNVGGLIGEMHGGKVEKSAAALIVIEEFRRTRASAETGKHNAGGLIGAIYARTDGGSDEATIVGSVVGCYSGGHTTRGGRYGGVYKIAEGFTDFNVTAAYGCAGGLIGDANGAQISYSYSTCSVGGEKAGGFVGASADGKISNCYATGLVRGRQADDGTETEGAFAGSLTVREGGALVPSYSALSNCRYYMIVNERVEDGVYSYLEPVSGQSIPEESKSSDEGGDEEKKVLIKALDKDALEFNEFADMEHQRDANVYDEMLTVLFGKGAGKPRQIKYTLPSVEQLGLTLKTEEEDTTKYFVATHYGDWPAPETFVVNVIDT